MVIPPSPATAPRSGIPVSAEASTNKMAPKDTGQACSDHGGANPSGLPAADKSGDRGAKQRQPKQQ